MSTETSATKKPRALPRRWQRFHTLKRNDGFTIGKNTYAKTGVFSARRVALLTSERITVWPWTRVQTLQLVRNAQPGGTFSEAVQNTLKNFKGRVIVTNCDDVLTPACCAPGHCGEGQADAVVAELDAAKARVDAVTPGPVIQPNSDNKVTGPTS
jgi:hypothetical protein